jgi:hypothetical protein
VLGRYDWLGADSRLAGPGHSTAGTKALSEPLGPIWEKTHCENGAINLDDNFK